MKKINIEDVLLSKNITAKIKKDFTLFEAENFLPSEIYNELNLTFPSVELIKKATPASSLTAGAETFWLMVDNQLNQDGVEDHNDVQSLWSSFLEENPIWKDFIDLIYSKKFVDDALREFNSEIKSRGIRYFFRKNKYKEKVSNVKMASAFSVRGNNSTVEPHTDAGGKLLTLLLYFPQSNWEEENGGSTLFYTSKDGSKGGGRKWRKLGKRNTLIPDVKSGEKASDIMKDFYDRFKVFYSTSYVPNMLAGFVKNNCSWHRSEKIKCKNLDYRRLFMINIKMISQGEKSQQDQY